MNEVEQNKNTDVTSVQLNGLYGFKVGMSTVYDEAGKIIPVTVVRVDQSIVSQIKTNEKDGYMAVQIAFKPKKAKNSTKAEVNHLKATSFENGAAFIKEIRQDLPEGIEVGQKVELSSLAQGDVIKITGVTKGRGFAGTVKRWGHGGGPASHGSGFHRRPGSIGNCTWPGRVMKGRKMPGHYGVETKSIKNVKVISVIPEENVVLVKGPVPGSRNSLVKMMKA